MNQRFSKMILLALVIFILGSSCKSHKKTAAITNVGSEKTKTQTETKSQSEGGANESKLNSENEYTFKIKLDQYFEAIANASNTTSANASIDEALSMFTSALSPVLIVISQEGDQKDYDRPTTIRAYLNYLKDQKKNINKIDHLKLDDSGKISEVELRKN